MSYTPKVSLRRVPQTLVRIIAVINLATLAFAAQAQTPIPSS